MARGNFANRLAIKILARGNFANRLAIKIWQGETLQIVWQLKFPAMVSPAQGSRMRGGWL
jgi:hypothetical protein